MDSADPRTQPAPQQQPHHNHHHSQHHAHQQRQPQQPPNELQQPLQPPHHVQIAQPQPLHHQSQTAHPQHAQQSQPGYSSPANYQFQMQLPHQPTFTTRPYSQGPYTPNIQQYSYGSYMPITAWAPTTNFPRPVSSVPVSTPTQSLASTPKAPLAAREKKTLKIIDPKTKEPVDLTAPGKPEKSSSDTATNSTKSTTSTSPSKQTNQQNKTAASTTSSSTLEKAASFATSAADATPSKNKSPQTASKNSAVSANLTGTNNVTSSSTSDRAATSSPPSVSHMLLQKVSEDTSSDKRQEVVVTSTAQATSSEAPSSPVSKAPAEKITEPQIDTAPTTAIVSNPEPKDETKIEEQKETEPAVTEHVPNVDVEKEEHDKKVDDKDGNDCDGDSTKEEADGEITLHYEKGQYNPKTKTGKKKYSREFMLGVCEKICKLDINSEVSSDNSMPTYNLERTDPFSPAYQQPFMKYQSSAASNRQNPNYAGRSSAGQERQRKVIVPSSSLTNEVELKTVSNPWRPGSKAKEDEPEDIAEVETLKKKFRSILNKLTPQNFDSLAQAVTELHIDTEAKLGEVIDIVFAKALAEPGYCVLYGQMCSHLKKITAGAANFGNTLLKRCQNQFNADIYQGLDINERKEKIEKEQDPEKKKIMDEELYEDMYRCRMRGLGLIKFIGELYKIEMLNDAIMFDCIQRLLSDPSSEESMECLCDLLKTIGEKLDRSSQANSKEKKGQKNLFKANSYKSALAAPGPSPRVPEQITTLDPIFETLHKIRKNKDSLLSMRIKFKLLDLCELREKDNWQSKGKDNNPKKLDEIKKDHLESERQKSMGPRKSQEGRRGQIHGSGSSSQISSLGNESGPNRTNFHSSASSQSIRDHDHGEKMLRDNSDTHKLQEQHRSYATSILKKFSGDGSSTGSLIPTGAGKTESLRPSYRRNLGTTATNDTTKSTTNSANANAAASGSGSGGSGSQ